MTKRLRAGAVVGTLGLAAALSISPRAETPRPLVSVPVFVTDARGDSIRNLQAPEIEIAEGGTQQKISSLVFRGGAPRRVAIYLDEYHVSPGAGAERARGALARFVERHLGPDDAVVVMKPLDPQSSTAPLASVEAVHRAVADFEGRRGNFEPRTEFEAQYMSVAPPSAGRQRAQVVRAGLESLAIAMREGADAARAMIVVTEGFRSSDPATLRPTTLPTIARAARLANVPVYILDPSAASADSPLDGAWASMSEQTGGMLFTGGADLDGALARVAADLQSHYVVEFQGAGREDGGFHGIDVRVTRRGARVRAASGYWAPFGASRLPPMTAKRPYASLLTPHVSGLIQPWFRMAPAAGGRTTVTFAFAARPGRRVTAERVEFTALTFEGDTVHAATVVPAGTAGAGAVETTFEAPPGPLQVSMRIAAAKPLDTDVRYIDVPRLDGARPVIAAVEFVRPRSLPEFRALQADGRAIPTEAREFLRRDRLLVRVRAFAGSTPVVVRARLLNRLGQPLLDLPPLRPVDGAAQFDLPFARYPRGDYGLEVQATAGGEPVTQLLTVRVVG